MAIMKINTNTKGGLTMIKITETVLLCDQLHMILESGLTLETGIDAILEELSDKETKEALTSIQDSLQENMSFAKACEKTGAFDAYFIQMVKIGEETGYLDNVLKQLSIYYNRLDSMNKKIKDAIFYPSLLFVMMLVLMGILVVKVLPIFRNVLNSMGTDISSLALVLMNIGQKISEFGFAILVVIALAVVIVLLTYRIKYKERATSMLLSNFIFTKSLMRLFMNSGLDFANAFELLPGLVDNRKIRERIELCNKEIEDGKSALDALIDAKIFKSVYTRILKIAQKSGKLDDTMSKVAKDYENEMSSSINRFLNIIEPTIMISCVIIVGIILLSVMLPLMSIMTSLG
jgi:type IV pilus assembly protein PilC